MKSAFKLTLSTVLLPVHRFCGSLIGSLILSTRLSLLSRYKRTFFVIPVLHHSAGAVYQGLEEGSAVYRLST